MMQMVAFIYPDKQPTIYHSFLAPDGAQTDLEKNLVEALRDIPLELVQFNIREDGGVLFTTALKYYSARQHFHLEFDADTANNHPQQFREILLAHLPEWAAMVKKQGEENQADQTDPAQASESPEA